MTLRERLQDPMAEKWLCHMLKSEPANCPVVVGSGLVWKQRRGDRDAPAWKKVFVRLGYPYNSNEVHCYVRNYDSGFVISDCGECIAAVMRLTKIITVLIATVKVLEVRS